jgi:N-acetylglutamate synthase-like GNAT family acetyltransferase
MVATMSFDHYRVRRATLDDIGQLTKLWQGMHYPAEELARRITEFQVAESSDGKIAGAVGLQQLERQGRLHSEGFDDFSLADQLRPQLWDRLQSVATNNGLLRLWTQEEAPFWSQCGLTRADAEAAEKLPAPWRALKGNWLTLKLKEDIEEVLTADKEFAAFMQSERQRTERAMQQAKVLKFIAALLAVGVLFLVMAGAFLLIRRNPQLLRR